MIRLIIIFTVLVVIETILLKIFLQKKWFETLKFCTAANLFSAILCFASLLIFSFVPEPFSGTGIIIFYLLVWIVLPAMIIWAEYAVYKMGWRDIPKKKLLWAAASINLITYILFALVVYFTKDMREKERWKRNYRITCFCNLKQIGLSLKQYAMDYDGFFPDKGFEQLRAGNYLRDHGIYVCPASGTRRGEDKQKLTEENVDYIYRNGLQFDPEDAETPLVWDKAKNHTEYEDYGQVLFVNGQIKGFRGPDWMEQAGIKKKAAK